MDRLLIEYAINAAWQLPLLALAVWLLIRATRPAAAVQYSIWVGVLSLAAALPLAGIIPNVLPHSPASTPPPTVAPIHISSPEAFAAGLPPRTAVANAGLSAIPRIPNPDAAAPAQLPGRVTSPLHLTRRIVISAPLAHWIALFYLLILFVATLRIFRAWAAAQRLVRQSSRAVLTAHEQSFVAECARRMGIPAAAVPQLRVADHALQGPVVVGAVRPLLICPPDFLRTLLAAGRSDEAMAALCHEFAHIQRSDYVSNLICQALAVPLKWHPATYAVERRIQGTREMACDAIAARVLGSSTHYARCLVSLAERLSTSAPLDQPAAIGLFHANTLEERVMRLMQTTTNLSRRTRLVRVAAGTAAMAAALTLAALVHVVPAHAQSNQASRASTAAAVAPAPAPTPVQAAHPVAPAPAAQPVPAAAPRPSAAPAPTAGKSHARTVVVSRDGKLYVWQNGHDRNLTPAERARIEQQLKDAQKKIAAETARITSPEFRAQIQQAQEAAMLADRKLQSGEIQRQIAEAQKRINSLEFKKQIEDAQRQARINVQKQLNSLQFRQQMALAQKQAQDALARLQSPEFQKHIAEAQHEAMDAQRKIESGEIQKQLAQAQMQADAAIARLQSPEFHAQIEKAQHDAMAAQNKIMSGQIQRQLAQAQKQIQEQLDKLEAQDSKPQK